MNNEEKEAYNKAETEVKKSYEKQKEKALQEFEIQLNKKIAEEKEKYRYRNINMSELENQLKKFKDENLKKNKEFIEKQVEEGIRKDINKNRENISQKVAELKQNYLNKCLGEKNKNIKFLKESLKKGKEDFVNTYTNTINELDYRLYNNKLLEYSNLFDKIYLIDEINLNLMGYYAQNENSKAQFAPIRGGCLPEINNKLKIIKISDNDNIKNELFRNIIINSENFSEEFTYNNNYYLGIMVNIENGYLGSDFCRNILNINGLIENYNVESIVMKRTQFLKDNQKTRGMYKILYNNNNFNKNEIFEKNIYGDNAALYSVLYNDNKSVEKIISLGGKNSFEIENDNELNSF